MKEYECFIPQKAPLGYEHNDDSPLATKKVATQHLDQLAFIYIFYYINVSYEPMVKLKVVPSEGAVEQPSPMDVDEPSNPTTSSTSPSVSMDVDGSVDPSSSTVSGEKRKGPESRMITIGPEAKKSKLENLVEYLLSEKVICRTATSSTSIGSCVGLTEDIVLIDSVWIRKWKRMPDGSKSVKSRQCARGCFDSQKDLLSARSTTATRLSQRLLLSTAANMAWDIESWDVSGAFLKGLSFERVREILQSKSIATPVRRVAMVAPANVWQHLGNFSAAFHIDLKKIHEYVLYCLKPIYGLNDAPLAWQLCLHGHFEEQGGRASLLDENLFYWKDGSKVKAIVTTHVDDCGAGAKTEWLAKQRQLLVQKFGKVT